MIDSVTVSTPEMPSAEADIMQVAEPLAVEPNEQDSTMRTGGPLEVGIATEYTAFDGPSMSVTVKEIIGLNLTMSLMTYK
jgi:hypothetical protein